MTSLLRTLLARLGSQSPSCMRGNRCSAPARKPSFRPQLETLEDRRVLSSTASIGGHVLVDPTGNGLFQNTTAQSGVKVELFADTNKNGVLDGADRLVTSRYTAADGSYSFGSLAAGGYFVREIAPGGFVRLVPTTQSYFTVGLADGQSVTGEDFVNFHKLDTSVVTNVSFTITAPNGTTTTVTNLRGQTVSGDTVTVNFTIAAGSSPTVVSFAAYDAPGSSFNAGTASQQVLVEDSTGTFGPGQYSLSVVVPNDFYQIDFVVGNAIDRFGPAGSNLFYSAEGRLVSADNGGTQAQAASMLSGTVVDSNGVGLQSVEIILKGTNDLGQTVNVTVYTDKFGNYTFTGLRPGTYAIAPAPVPDYTFSTATSGAYSGITVGNGTSATGYNFTEVLVNGGIGA
jgi:hypothetical protein